MSCESWLPTLLQAAEDGLDTLSRPDRDSLEAHLETCADCRLALEEQQAVRDALTARVDAAVPPGFSTRVVSQLDVGVSWVDMLRWRTWSYRLAPVAMGLLVFGLVTARSAGEPDESVGLAELAEVWAFGEEHADTRPAFTLWGQEDVSGDVLLDTVLSAEPDEVLAVGDPS